MLDGFVCPQNASAAELFNVIRPHSSIRLRFVLGLCYRFNQNQHQHRPLPGWVWGGGFVGGGGGLGKGSPIGSCVYSSVCVYVQFPPKNSEFFYVLLINMFVVL